uniref:tRNA (guanosine(18)-2'-O)-methyltransferase TARBP1 n=3 Tax=Trichogramma TaxID=7490 RepID=A0ABD2VUJ1_9HYME
MKEWLLIRIYLTDKSLIPDLWTFFEKICEERPGSTSSLICVIWHIARQLPLESLESYLKMALQKLSVCCMGQQFGMRLFGQVFFLKLYHLLDKHSDVRLEYAPFYKAISESLDSGTFKKNPIKIDEDFFYNVFDPVRHYSLETIYHQLPRLANVSIEEWIKSDQFETQIGLKGYTLDIEVKNSDSLLNQSSVPYAILKSNDNQKSEEIEVTVGPNDMQKKVSLWKTIIPNEEVPDLKYELKAKRDIIIIASLVDKPQNLGGIARTCEIFGVKELVVSNFKQIEDKEFQALSVSADKWIKITEVKPFVLDKYLLELKENDWSLIGAEQTTNSINLMDLKFPKKTVLILGNEKNGIPANIISLLDICVEIPQFGVIRSLNVHVTSAICIWEYVKQSLSVT